MPLMNDGQNAAIFWLLTRVNGGGEVGVENRVCYFKCKFSRLPRPYKNSSRKCPLEFPGSSSFAHSSFQFPLLCRLCNKGFIPLAARTLLWSPANRSGYNNTTEGLLALVKNTWNQVDVNRHFTMTLVHSSCLRNTWEHLALCCIEITFPRVMNYVPFVLQPLLSILL